MQDACANRFIEIDGPTQNIDHTGPQTTQSKGSGTASYPHFALHLSKRLNRKAQVILAVRR